MAESRRLSAAVMALNRPLAVRAFTPRRFTVAQPYGVNVLNAARGYSRQLYRQATVLRSRAATQARHRLDSRARYRARSTPQGGSKVRSRPGSQARSQNQPKSRPLGRLKSRPQGRVKPQNPPQNQPLAKPQTVPQAQSPAKPQVPPQGRPVAKPEVPAQAQPPAKPQVPPQVQPVAQPQVPPQAQEQTQVQQRQPIRLQHIQATELLKQAGLNWTSSGKCSDRRVGHCTSLQAVRAATVDNVIALKKSSQCPIVITGGTEIGHAPGPYSHHEGYKLDIKPNKCINSYIKEHHPLQGVRGDGARLYGDPSGTLYARESNHWDILFH
ncbi:hypothetical protein J2853_007229 [Streptosporangium lutulentum]|uniref:Uncharacterized protein n=1 Tax=Streptosporangium lutulentum TaxID=1461250 RepID=A0ABT9QMM8_9ACTN|nr:hypothetical protein [Streptosporangium lutulentum]MDP9848018.1 hypothetical protein [Streptosporangium lutulentum]